MLRNAGVATLKILAFLLLWACLTGLVIYAAITAGGQDFYSKTEYRVGVEIALTVATVLPLLLLGLFLDRRRAASFGFSARLFDVLSGTVLGAAILCAPIGILLMMGAAQYRPDLAGFSATGLALGLVVCFFNVVTQEVLVRGYMFQELWSKFGAWIATIFTTIIFIAMHAGAIVQGTAGLLAAANILLASLLLSLAYVRTASLWLPIGIHLGWNGLQGPVLGINVTGHDLAFGHWSVFTFPGDALWTGGAMGVEGGLAGLIGPALGIVLVAFLFKQQPKPDFTPRPK